MRSSIWFFVPVWFTMQNEISTARAGINVSKGCHQFVNSRESVEENRKGRYVRHFCHFEMPLERYEMATRSELSPANLCIYLCTYICMYKCMEIRYFSTTTLCPETGVKFKLQFRRMLLVTNTWLIFYTILTIFIVTNKIVHEYHFVN